LKQFGGAHPNRQIDLTVTGDNRGRWDGPRLQQLLRNLISNAIRHGFPDTPIHVRLRGEKARVCLEVTNSGPNIESSAVAQIFDPLNRGRAPDESFNSQSGLGLGLFIVREIARAHGGEVVVRSEEGETTFAVHLPRHVQDTIPSGRPPDTRTALAD
jgi:signal transduction histidine kinase